ncbi:MAG: VanZ family protein [Fimbriimonadaceae bacterium]|nr:VanZ family protein [Chthonomonadaceae bacterium]MCO5297160.1 VanZ family protein [Fimbriimonadaceae bacterium]
MSKRAWIPPVLCAAVITAMSNAFISATSFKGAVGKRLPVPNGQQWFDEFWSHYWWLFVKGFHFLEFALLFFLLWGALRPRLGIAALLAALFAMVDEYHQSFISFRGGRWTDVLIDWAGVATCAVLVAALARRHRDA